jgi:hypothetical protein
MKINNIKIRNWIAVNAWNRQAGPMKGNRRDELDWKKEWEEELIEYENEYYLSEMPKNRKI